MAGVGRLLRLLRVRRLPRHRVQRDPRGGRRHRRQPPVQVPGHGPGRDRLADRVITRDATKLKVGQVYYTPWCDEHGKVIDDGTVHRVGEHELRWTAADPQYRWLTLNAAGLDVTIEDVTEEVAALALQGPFSRAVLEAATGEDFADLRYFRRRATKIAGKAVDVSRTGYTGDLGYELWIPAEAAGAVWDALFAAGKAYAIRPAGMVALDVTRLEAGLIMLEVDYTSARHAMNPEQNYSPFEIGLGKLVTFDKADYVGRRALEAEEAAGGPARRLVGLQLDWYDIERLFDAQGLPPAISPSVDRSPVPVFDGGKQVGKATSHGWSPILKQAIALAFVPARYERTGHEAPGGVDGRGPPGPGRRRPSWSCRSWTSTASGLTGARHARSARRRRRSTSPRSTPRRGAPRGWTRSWSSTCDPVRGRRRRPPPRRRRLDRRPAPPRRRDGGGPGGRRRAAAGGRRARRRAADPHGRPALRHPARGAARAVDHAAVRAGDPRRPGLGPRRDRQQGRVPAPRLGARGVDRDAIGPLPCRVRYLVEGQEETGSNALDALLDLRPRLRVADAALIEGGDSTSTGRPRGRRRQGHRRARARLRTMAHDAHSSLTSSCRTRASGWSRRSRLLGRRGRPGGRAASTPGPGRPPPEQRAAIARVDLASSTTCASD